MTKAKTRGDTLAELLLEIGYKAEKIDDDSIQSSFSGTKVFVHWYEGGSIQFLAGWSSPPETFDVKAVNLYNSSYRFGSVFLDDEKINLQANFLIDLEEKDARDILETAIQIFEGLIHELISAINNVASQDDT